MHTTPAETEKLLLAVAGMVARDRRERGVLLNYPESVALLSTWVIERAREGASVVELMEQGRSVLRRDEVMPGVPEIFARKLEVVKWDGKGDVLKETTGGGQEGGEGGRLDAEHAEAAGFAVVIGITTYFSLIAGELVPKQFALRAPERIAIAMAGPMVWLSRVAAPMSVYVPESDGVSPPEGSGSHDVAGRVVGLGATNAGPGAVQIPHRKQFVRTAADITQLQTPGRLPFRFPA